MGIVLADALHGDPRHFPHVTFRKLAALHRLNHGVDGASVADLPEVTQDRPVDSPLFIDQLVLGDLDKGLVVVHLQHLEQVLPRGGVELVTAGHGDRFGQQLMRGPERVAAVGVRADHRAQRPRRIGDLKPPAAHGQHLRDRLLCLLAPDLGENIDQPGAQ